ncbi:MAG: DNA polymerase-4 [Halioglobus sp.]
MAEQRKILHIDADSFYASVEMRENPELRGKAIAVGGKSDRRGVIATCNYEARKFGVHSAMASSRAMSICPQLIIVPAQFELYRAVSAQFHQIFRDYTDLIEPLSLDEAYLDVSECQRCSGSATLMALEIMSRIEQELKITVSAGVAPNKFLAKVASDWNKPNGVFTIPPADVDQFVRGLPVKKINGVGNVTAGRLAKMGVVTCEDLQSVPLNELVRVFGKYGKRLSEVARGIDTRAVQATRSRKSISVEHTFAEDIADLPSMLDAMDGIVAELDKRYEKIHERYYPVKRIVKIKFKDFTQTTREQLIGSAHPQWCEPSQFRQLLQAAWPRGAKPVRLLGAGLRLQPTQREEHPQFMLV